MCSRPGGATGGETRVTSAQSLGRRHALLRLLVTKGNSGCLSPCLGWSRNSRRPVAFSPPPLRATDPSLTDREGNVQMVWTTASQTSHSQLRYSHQRLPRGGLKRNAELIDFTGIRAVVSGGRRIKGVLLKRCLSDYTHLGRENLILP